MRNKGNKDHGAGDKKKEYVRDEDLGINVAIDPDRKLDGSIAEANDELSDAYMIYRELVSRCTIDFESLQTKENEPFHEDETVQAQAVGQVDLTNDSDDNSSQNDTVQDAKAAVTTAVRRRRKRAAKVYYFKPESFTLLDPDRQRHFREKIMRKIKKAPSFSKPPVLADELQASYAETIADKSRPDKMRKVLADYFSRKQYVIQHKRYKLLLRWAHYALRSRNIDPIARQAEFMLGKLQLELDSTIKRAQRLAIDDDYLRGLQPDLRPTSRSQQSDGTLYVELKDIPAQSCIRQDDIEVYLRHVTYASKINRLSNKFIARLKWMGVSRRYDVFDSMVAGFFDRRKQHMEKRLDFWRRADKAAKNSAVLDEERLAELKQIKDAAHVINYKKQMSSDRQRVFGACRPDHDVSPDIISSTIEAKQMIRDLATTYGLNAELDQDDGFSFGYQLTLFFPSQFQVLVLKSQFSLYDAFAGQDDEQSAFRKRNFAQGCRADPNIFKDIAANSNQAPSEESIVEEVAKHDIKVTRLKAAPWMQFVDMMPTVPDWLRKQDAILCHENNAVDQLLEGAMDFLDVNDQASVNMIITEAADNQVELARQQTTLKQRAQKSKIKIKVQVQSDMLRPDPGETRRSSVDEEAELAVEEDVYQTVSATSVQQIHHNMYLHMTNCLTGTNLQEMLLEPRKSKLRERPRHIHKDSFYNLNKTLAQSMITLRYMKSREHKTQVQYALNYFRSIQKRITVDLREFATRERMLGDVTDPLMPPEEGDLSIIDAHNMHLANAGRAMRLAREGERENSQTERSERAGSQLKGDLSQMQMHLIENGLGLGGMSGTGLSGDVPPPTKGDGVSMMDFKKHTLNGKLDVKHLSTCPVLPRFHATFGEPTEILPEFVQSEQDQQKQEITRSAMKYLNRVDHIEINEKRSEVYVKDDFNIYIMYECAVTDMRALEQELLRVGSYYISRMEELYDTEVDRAIHTKDRQQVLQDLLECESQFQFKKVILTQLYMEAYEHICDPVDQQRMMKAITDLMARRPRLSLDSLYFRESYQAEYDCLDAQIALFEIYVANQIKLEKEANTQLHESLNMSYRLAQLKTKEGWAYSNPDELLESLISRFFEGEHDGVINVNYDAEGEKQSTVRSGLTNPTEKKSTEPMDTDEARIRAVKKKNLREMRYVDEDLEGDAFTKLLGLPKVTVQHLFDQNRDCDDIIEDIMAENSHFTHRYEGYPDLKSMKESGQSKPITKRIEASTLGLQKNSVTTAASAPEELYDIQLDYNKWQKRPQMVSILDFFSDALGGIPKLLATLTQCNEELQDALKPHTNAMASHLEAAVYKNALLQYKEMLRFVSGTEKEYEKAECVESELITGSSDQLMFYLKDFNASFARSSGIVLNPFLTIKMDNASIRLGHFPHIKKEDNPYSMKKQGLKEELMVSLAMAESQYDNAMKGEVSEANHFYQHYIVGYENNFKRAGNDIAERSHRKSTSTMGGKKEQIKPPSMLKLCCNAIEMLRLRQELIMCISECKELTEVYERQMHACGMVSVRARMSEALSFENSIVDDDALNYADEGPGFVAGTAQGLAIGEVDPSLASNLNFRSPDSIKIFATDCGLEELRALLNYQMMQKQALIVAVRTNSSLVDLHQRAERELELLEQRRLGLPNMVVPLDKIFSKYSEEIEMMNFAKVRRSYKSNMADQAGPLFLSVGGWKTANRTSLSKQYKDASTRVEKLFQVPEVKLRMLRSYKTVMITQYIRITLQQIWADSIKYNLMSKVQRVRTLNQYFHFNPWALGITEQEEQNSPLVTKFATNLPKVFDDWKEVTFSQLFSLDTTSSLLENGFQWYQMGRYVDQVEECVRVAHWTKHQAETQSASGVAPGGGLATFTSNIAVKLPKQEALDFKKCQQLSLFVLPSSAAIMQLDTSVGNWPDRCTLEDMPFDYPDVGVKTEGTEILLPTTDEWSLTDVRRLPCFRIYSYYHQLENVVSLELSIAKFALEPALVAELDDCMANGVPFFQGRDVKANEPVSPELVCSSDLSALVATGKAVPNLAIVEKGKKIEQDHKTLQEHPAKRNLLSAKILRETYMKRRSKADVAEELYDVAMRIKEVVHESRRLADKVAGIQGKTQSHFDSDYLEQYAEVRYLQVVSLLARMREHFQLKGQQRGSALIDATLKGLAKRDHVKISAVKTNGSAHVNQSDVNAMTTCIETSTLMPHFGSEYEAQNFSRCIYPVLSDRALEPQELTILQSLYLFSESTTVRPFAGFPLLQSPFTSQQDLTPLQHQLVCLDAAQRRYVNSNMKQMDEALEDYMNLIVNENLAEGRLYVKQRTMSTTQMRKAARFLCDQVEGIQLKAALAVFVGGGEQARQYYSKDMMWRILEEKEHQKSVQTAKYGDLGAEVLKNMAELRAEIYQLSKIDERKITDEQHSRRQKLQVQQMQAEQKRMRGTVLLDQILFARALIICTQNELERRLIKAAVKTIDAESVALATCLKNQAREIEAHIHPFQQFAVTLYDKVDPQSHLDPLNKVGQIQSFLTRLKNRGTEVETLTSGPGYVFTLKDINDCVGQLTKGLIKYSEAEMRSRCEFAAKKEQQYLHKLYLKDQQIESLEHRMNEQARFIEKMVNARMFEKGNEMVFELDQANRMLKILKDNMNNLEERVRREIDGQYKTKVLFNQHTLDLESSKFKQMRTELVANMEEQAAKDEIRLTQAILAKTKKFADLDEPSPAKYLMPRPRWKEIAEFAIAEYRKAKRAMAANHTRSSGQPLIQQQAHVRGKSIGYVEPHLMREFQEQPLRDDQEIDTVNELGKPYSFPVPIQQQFLKDKQEARADLADLTAKTRRMHVFHKWRQLAERQRYEERIFNLERKLSNNAQLWEQLGDAQRREDVLREELTRTQQALGNSERLVEALKGQIKKIDMEKARLQNFKQQKGKRLDELESKVQRYEFFQKVDVEKLIQCLYSQQRQLETLKGKEDTEKHLREASIRFNADLRQLKTRLVAESRVKSDAIQQLETMRAEMKALELAGGSTALLWKKKAAEMVELCVALQEDNERLGSQCQQLAAASFSIFQHHSELSMKASRVESSLLLNESKSTARSLNKLPTNRERSLRELPIIGVGYPGSKLGSSQILSPTVGLTPHAGRKHSNDPLMSALEAGVPRILEDRFRSRSLLKGAVTEIESSLGGSREDRARARQLIQLSKDQESAGSKRYRVEGIALSDYKDEETPHSTAKKVQLLKNARAANRPGGSLIEQMHRSTGKSISIASSKDLNGKHFQPLFGNITTADYAAHLLNQNVANANIQSATFGSAVKYDKHSSKKGFISGGASAADSFNNMKDHMGLTRTTYKKHEETGAPDQAHMQQKIHAHFARQYPHANSISITNAGLAASMPSSAITASNGVSKTHNDVQSLLYQSDTKII